MTPEINTQTIARPGLVSSFTTGFNVVANHVQWILIPLMFDLALWLGPHLRLKTLSEPLMLDMTRLFAQMNTPDSKEFYEIILEFWRTLFERYNLLSALSTLPIGLPGLMVGIAPLQNPFGNAVFWEIKSFLGALLLWLVISLLGIALGSIYFSGVSGLSAPDNDHRTWRLKTMQMLQAFLLTIALLAVLLIILFPISIALSLLTFVSPALAQFGMLITSFGIIWLAIPLMFSPHGIYTFNKNAIQSIWNSLRLTRLLMPRTGVFILLAMGINQILNMLWTIPEEISWMALVGIAGHAFISTGLLSASFVYYRGGINYIQEVMQHLPPIGSMRAQDK